MVIHRCYIIRGGQFDHLYPAHYYYYFLVLNWAALALKLFCQNNFKGSWQFIDNFNNNEPWSYSLTIAAPYQKHEAQCCSYVYDKRATPCGSAETILSCTQPCSMPYPTRDNIYLIPDSYSRVAHDFDYCLITSPLTSFLTIEVGSKNRGDRLDRRRKVFFSLYSVRQGRNPSFSYFGLKLLHIKFLWSRYLSSFLPYFMQHDKWLYLLLIFF